MKSFLLRSLIASVIISLILHVLGARVPFFVPIPAFKIKRKGFK